MTKSKKERSLGIRSSREVNIAMLGKHTWDLIFETPKLWTRILKKKYLKRDFILHIKEYKGNSYTWKYIRKAIESLEVGELVLLVWSMVFK